MTTHTPVLRSGQAMRTYGVARALAAGSGRDGLTLLYVRFGGDEPDASFAAIDGIELRAVVIPLNSQGICSGTRSTRTLTP